MLAMCPRRLWGRAGIWAAVIPIVQAAGAGAAAQGPPGDGSARVRYQIEARLEAPAMQLSGRERITWTNRSQDTVSDLWFHLYLNAFANNRSSHFWEGR